MAGERRYLQVQWGSLSWCSFCPWWWALVMHGFRLLRSTCHIVPCKKQGRGAKRACKFLVSFMHWGHIFWIAEDIKNQEFLSSQVWKPSYNSTSGAESSVKENGWPRWTSISLLGRNLYASGRQWRKFRRFGLRWAFAVLAPLNS